MHLSSDSTFEAPRPYILGLILAGDETELEHWVESEEGSLHAFIRSRVPSYIDLADIMQDTFALALSRLGEFDPKRGSMRNWLRTLSRNIIRDTLRKYQRELPFDSIPPVSPLAFTLAEISDADLPDKALQREETRDLVLATMGRLSAPQRELLEAKYIDERSVVSLAQEHDATIDAIKGKLRRARASFREMFLALLHRQELES